MNITDALTFDDILLVPAESDIIPSQANTTTSLTKKIKLNIPIISSAMDTVTEAKMAISMSQNGGVGVIHKNLTPKYQARQVKKVKMSETGLVLKPYTLYDTQTVQDYKNKRKQKGFGTFPVISEKDNTLLGIITRKDISFATSLTQSIKELMTPKSDLITATYPIDEKQVKDRMKKNKIEKMLIIDNDYKLCGMVTIKDFNKLSKYPNATRDKQQRLVCAAAVGTGEGEKERIDLLIKAEVDIIVVDTAHGHSKNVFNMVKYIKEKSPDITVIAGNIATSKAAEFLIEAGADAVKVGIGPGSICTTRIVTGVGVPQLTAIQNVAKVCNAKGIGVIADGGIKHSGDISKAIAVGADCVMVGSLLAGTEESPGETILLNGRSYKSYRGMGSLGAMAKGSADRYFQAEHQNNQQKLVPEGIEGRVSYKGSVDGVLHQLVGGLKASMGYTGNQTIKEMQNNAEFVKITNSGLSESHVHNITITQEAPNYKTNL